MLGKRGSGASSAHSRAVPRRAVGFATILAAALFAGSVTAAAPLQPTPTAAGSEPVVVLPETDYQGAMPGAGGIEIASEVVDGRRLYSVWHDGRRITASVPVAPEEAWHWRVVYNPAKGRFDQLLSSVRVELRDYARLDEMVRQIGGVEGKAYPQLGYAIIGLDPAHHPLAAVRSLEQLPGVLAAEVRVQRPAMAWQLR